MFLDYLSLVILLMGLTLVFYTFIYIHDMPHGIAKKNKHPQRAAIHVACWLSLFTLHAIWPIVFIWAVSHNREGDGGDVLDADLEQNKKIAELETRLAKLETKK